MGEVAAENKLPSLLITDAPRVVGSNQAFKLKVSTRNLVRDRFLGAAAGGYYLESSFLRTPPACSAGTSTPPAGSCLDQARRPTRRRRRSSSSPRRTTAAARPGHRDDQRAAGIKTAGHAAVHLVGR